MIKRPSVFSRIWAFVFLLMVSSVSLSLFSSSEAQALELDWSGQFWSELNFIFNSTMDSNDSGFDPNRFNTGTGPGTPEYSQNQNGGYYIPSGGTKDVAFQTVFLRLKPSLIVNDNIYIKSEWWLGDPIYGIFGNSLPFSQDQRWYYSNQSRGSVISAQRYWAEFVTDLGTIQVGRVPLQWGLGLVWNNGDSLFSRYLSTGDAVRWIAKFGSFTFIPSFVVGSAGIAVGGNAQVNNQTGVFTSNIGGTGGVQDLSLLIKYENTEDELEGGINLIRRWGGSGQDASYNMTLPGATATTGLNNAVSGFTNYTIYDIFARKKFNKLSLGIEAPITSGSLGSASFNSFGIAGELEWKAFDFMDIQLKAGYASGQPDSPDGNLNNYQAFYFNPNYHVGMIMFNYQLANLYRPQTMNNPNLDPRNLGSIYDNPIVNAIYGSLTVPVKPFDKWTIRPTFLYAYAPQAAGSSGYSFNYWGRNQNKNNGKAQGHNLGFEIDLGVSFQWDEHFTFTWDNGIMLPGSFYAFSNSPSGVENQLSPVFASSFKVGVSF